MKISDLTEDLTIYFLLIFVFKSGKKDVKHVIVLKQPKEKSWKIVFFRYEYTKVGSRAQKTIFIEMSLVLEAPPTQTVKQMSSQVIISLAVKIFCLSLKLNFPQCTFVQGCIQYFCPGGVGYKQTTKLIQNFFIYSFITFYASDEPSGGEGRGQTGIPPFIQGHIQYFVWGAT